MGFTLVTILNYKDHLLKYEIPNIFIFKFRTQKAVLIVSKADWIPCNLESEPMLLLLVVFADLFLKQKLYDDASYMVF